MSTAMLTTADDDFEKLLLGHAPRDRLDPNRAIVSQPVRDAIAQRVPVEVIVLSADIRRSAFILKESINIPHYASVLEDFIAEFRTVLTYQSGWFDKFTGDGFICYWVVDKEFHEPMKMALDFSRSVLENFRSYYYPAFVANMRNVPSGAGLSVGIDAGQCYMLPVAGDLTLIGPPIVGAVRMNSASQAYTVLLNNYAASQLLEVELSGGELAEGISYSLSTRSIATKDYPNGQEAYSVNFLKKGKPLFADNETVRI